ncbi:signal peptidase I, partial [Streptococcus pneumoniae]|nr:signal peptidase I [Streptococcus pneumoniae]
VEEPYLDQYKTGITGTLTEDFVLEDITNYSTIPDGYVFVMGDNRRASKDSRHIGLVPIEEVIGNTNFVFWPVDEAG